MPAGFSGKNAKPNNKTKLLDRTRARAIRRRVRARSFMAAISKTDKMNKSLELLKETTAPAIQSDNPWTQVANECGNTLGKILKFNKGLWEIGDDEIPAGTQYVVLIDQVAREWVKFEDRVPTERLRYPVANKVPPPPREELDDNDSSQWELDDKGAPRDPWTLQWQLPMLPVGALGDLVIYTTQSKGGESCIANLCGIYGRSPRNGMLPIVELKTRSYKHKAHGKIQTPDLPIVGWDGGPSASPANESAPTANADVEAIALDDEIPF